MLELCVELLHSYSEVNLILLKGCLIWWLHLQPVVSLPWDWGLSSLVVAPSLCVCLVLDKHPPQVAPAMCPLVFSAQCSHTGSRGTTSFIPPV